jgi:putative ABC transport system permease protein
MPPDERDIDDELRGHLALAIQERVERGEDPDAARRAALAELGYVPRVRDSIRHVWYSQWFDGAMDLGRDLRVGLRSLRRARALSAAVTVTLALGIGANAAIFSVVRGVLLRPLVNRGEDRLVYIRQSAPGIGAANMTFSVPEIDDFKARTTTIEAFGDFSTIDFTLIGVGDPRVVRAGVVSGAFFEVMGLQPVLGRLLTRADDGPGAAGAAVLTHRFWTTALSSDPAVIGRTIRLGSRAATVVGVLEPSIPYPVDTEIIANVVTSPHHLDALMATGRTHRMTELFGRLAPGATLEAARAELTAAHTAMMEEHSDAYQASRDMRLSVTPFREAVTSQARPILLVLLAATGVVFVIACANVANLILARSVRREGELAVRAALGASRGALRRTLLAESLVLCTAGAALGVALAGPLVRLVAAYASQFSVRALDVTLDTSVLWIGAALAVAAAVLLAYAPALPMAMATSPTPLAAGGPRITPRLNRRLKAFATGQVACSFVLLAAAATLVASLVALQQQHDGADLQHVLAIDIPLPIEAFGPKAIAFNDEVMRRVATLPGVERVAVGNVVPWRDFGTFGPTPFAAEGYTPADGEEPPHAFLRNVSPGFFTTLGVPQVAGRGFNDDDRRGAELVVIVSQSLAERLFPNGEALNRHVWWTDRTFGQAPRRIVGVVADVNDQQAEPGPTLTIYHPFRQLPFAGRLFVRTAGDPYAFVPTITRLIREFSPDQPVERAATLGDIRITMLSPDRVNAFIVGGFATVALLIAAVGIAGVLAFSVSARIREFGVRLAVGSTPRDLLLGVLAEGAGIVLTGIVAGGAGGYALAAIAERYVDALRLPGTLPLAAAAAVLVSAAVAASLIPAARASRVDIQQALRTE